MFFFVEKPRPFVQSFFDILCRRPDSHTCFCCCFFRFVYLEIDVAFSEYFFVPFPLSLCIESKYVVRSFLLNSVFLPCDHGLDFLHQLIM